MSRICDSKMKVFCWVAFLYSLIYLFLIGQHRLPIDHDTFQYLQQQYVYFNEVVQNRSLPYWLPYYIHGYVGNYQFLPQLTLLSPVFYGLGLISDQWNYLYLYYFGLWFEELFFLLGIILLATLYYKNLKTILYVSITLLGTNIWYPQIWWNFHIYYFIPIVLYCLHRALTKGLFRYVIGAVLFFALAVYGNFLYCGVFVAFVVGVYFLFLVPVYFKKRSYLEGLAGFSRHSPVLNILKKLFVLYFYVFLYQGIKTLWMRKKILWYTVVFMGLIGLMAVSFYYVKYGDHELAYLYNTRDASGKIAINTFLNYGGSLGGGKFGEIFQRYGNSVDLNLYAGFCVLPFVFLALLFSRRKMSYVVGGTALVILLFSAGTGVAQAFYYVFPLGKVFRHIGLTASVFKLFMVLYAGFGFEIFLKRLEHDRRMVFVVGAFLIPLLWTLRKVYVLNPERFWFVSQAEQAVFAKIPYVLVGGLFLVFLYWMISREGRRRDLLVSGLLVLIFMDLFSYKYSLIVARMPKVSKEVISLFKPFKYAFPLGRLLTTESHAAYSDRVKKFLPLMRHNPQLTKYNTIDSFLFADSFVSSYRVDFILNSIKDYFSARELFPGEEIYRKYSGVGTPKLGVFSKINEVENHDAVGRVFRQPGFSGDMIFVAAEEIRKLEGKIPEALIQRQDMRDFQNRNERLGGELTIKQFSFNSLVLISSVPGRSDQPCFLYYADAYHPHWQAYVNGKKVPVMRVNIGYKAIPIPYGEAQIVFKFGNLFYPLSFLCTLLMSTAILFAILYVFFTEMISYRKKVVVKEIT